MGKGKTLIVWMKNGQTCHFEQVQNFEDGKLDISFSYFGVTTQVIRGATFLKNNIAGYALELKV